MLEFTLLERPEGKKTDAWWVICKTVGLGEIKWYTPWRRYCFYPDRETVFDVKCLSEIVDFINERMAERADARRVSQ